MQIKLADLSHKQELIEIWREAFGDDEDYISGFLGEYLIPGYNAPVIINNGKIASALYMIELELYADKRVVGKCAYLFAAATRESERGRGYMGELIRYAIELYKKRGFYAIFLFPQEGDESLFRYYAKFGFEPVYGAKRVNYSPINEPRTDDTPFKKMELRSDGNRELRNISFRLVNHDIVKPEIFAELYQAYTEFTVRQSLSPLKDKLLYYKCASSYLDEPDRHFGVFENNVEKFCYVFYKKFENNYYIDDIIMAECKKTREFNETVRLLTDYILSLGCGLEINMPPESFDDNKLAMILGLSEDIKYIIKGLDSPVYLNMYMNI